jgi:hypothetical protein
MACERQILQIRSWIDDKMIHAHLEVRDRPHLCEIALCFDV